MIIHRPRCQLLAQTILAAIWCIAAPMASAQQAEGDEGEVAILGGGMFGAGTRATVTGTTGLAISRRGMAVFNVSFIPLGQHTIQPWPASSTIDRSYLFDFGLDFHIRIPVKDRWVPYVLVGGGLLWNRIQQHTIEFGGIPAVYRYDQFNGAVHTGGGLRYYLRENWGVRSELKAIVSKQTYTQLVVGIFYVTTAGWP